MAIQGDGETFVRVFSGELIAPVVSWLRAEILGQQARSQSYRASLPEELVNIAPQALRRALLSHARGALKRHHVSSDDLHAWRLYRGVGELPRSARLVAAEVGRPAEEVLSISRRVERVLAHYPLQVVSSRVLALPEMALPNLHVALVLEDADAPTLAALADLQREANVAVPSSRGYVERHRRQRAAAGLRRRLGLEHRPSLPTISGLPAIDPQLVTTALAAEKEDQWARREQIASAVMSWQLERRPVAEMPEHLRVDAWALRQRLGRLDEDIRTLYAGQMVRRLAGRAVESVKSLRDDAIVLGAHGYRQAATAAAKHALDILPQLAAEPESRELERGSLLVRRALSFAPTASERVMKRRREMIDEALDAFDRGISYVIPREQAGAARNLIDLEMSHHWASQHRYRGRPQRTGISREHVESVEEILDASSDIMRQLGWRITKLRWALAADDPGVFAASSQEFVALYGLFSAPLRNQARRYQALRHLAASRQGQKWRELEMPPVPGNENSLVRFGEPAIWLM